MFYQTPKLYSVNDESRYSYIVKAAVVGYFTYRYII